MRTYLVPALDPALLAAALLVAALLPSVSFAQAADAANGSATLRVDSGQILVSDGGPFTTAETGNVLQSGSRVMLTDGASATLFFDEDCNQPLSGAGIHVVARQCVEPVAKAGTSQVKWGTVALVAGGVGLAAALVSGGGGDNDRPPPVSR